jgi:hypothetical protein
MESMQAMLKRVQKATDEAMASTAAQFKNIKKTSYMASNIMMLDFKKADYAAAVEVAENLEATNFRVKVLGGKFNRIYFTF